MVYTCPMWLRPRLPLGEPSSGNRASGSVNAASDADEVKEVGGPPGSVDSNFPPLAHAAGASSAPTSIRPPHVWGAAQRISEEDKKEIYAKFQLELEKRDQSMAALRIDLSGTAAEVGALRSNVDAFRAELRSSTEDVKSSMQQILSKLDKLASGSSYSPPSSSYPHHPFSVSSPPRDSYEHSDTRMSSSMPYSYHSTPMLASDVSSEYTNRSAHHWQATQAQHRGGSCNNLLPRLFVNRILRLQIRLC